MKIKPTIYAQMLIEALTEQSDTANIAKRFWHLLQKNKQYKDLPKILELLDFEHAKKTGLKVAKVYSEKPLTIKASDEIKSKLAKKYSSSPREAGVEKFSTSSNDKFIIKNIVQGNIVGITVKVDDQVIDLSLSSKINNLKKRFINIS